MFIDLIRINFRVDKILAETLKCAKFYIEIALCAKINLRENVRLQFSLS